jgi:Glycolipid transfer protein (GLTP)
MDSLDTFSTSPLRCYSMTITAPLSPRVAASTGAAAVPADRNMRPRRLQRAAASTPSLCSYQEPEPCCLDSLQKRSSLPPSTPTKLRGHASSPHLYETTLELSSRAEERSWIPSLTVGRLSVLLLTIVFLTDRFSWAASSSVLQQDPASVDHAAAAHRRVGLASAAITSVANVLSPILPFTGGVDLRRPDSWRSTVVEAAAESVASPPVAPRQPQWMVHLRHMALEIRGAFDKKNQVLPSIPHGGGVAESVKRVSVAPRRTTPIAISAAVPFVSVQTIAQMTLADVTETFRYAVLSSQSNFNEGKFLASVSPLVRTVVLRMAAAAATSRGPGVSPTRLSRDGRPEFGAVDALLFCAAMRIFGEWRVVRQVPDGYKSYAVGMTLGQKDIVQNLHKMEVAVHAWLDSHDASPTLHDLLQYESDLGLHPALPRLKDRTGSMGLLWVRRQLQYQTAIFHNIQSVPSPRFPSSKDAVMAAYHQVYDPYHGWAVQKIFDYSFQAAPDAPEIYACMNPHLKGSPEMIQQEAMRQVASYVAVADPLLSDLAGLFAHHNMNDPTKV